MQALPLFGLIGAALGGGLVGAVACYWPLRRKAAQLRIRLEKSEQARNGAVERSAQAREQIAQLNRAITELRRAHSMRSTQETQREQVEKMLAEGEDKTLVLPRRDALQAFADTLPMG
jgi:TolA-binding protein